MNEKSKKSSGVSAEKKETGFSIEKKGSGFSTEKKETGFSTEKKGSGISIEKKESGFSTEKKGSGLSTEKKESSLAADKQETGTPINQKENSIDKGESSPVANEKNSAPLKKHGKKKPVLFSAIGIFILVICLVALYVFQDFNESPNKRVSEQLSPNVGELEINDSDGDGLSDEFEESNGLDSSDPIDANSDKDGDGISNLEETISGTDMLNPDSANDGQDDGAEIASASNSNDELTSSVRDLEENSQSSSKKERTDANEKVGTGETSSVSRPSSIDTAEKINFKDFVVVANFARGSSFIEYEAKGKMFQLLQFLKTNTDKSVQLIGYASSEGESDFNLLLSERRAKYVRDFLVANGVPISRLQVIGMGSQNPIADNSQESGRGQNRRVEIKVGLKK
jgi:outer membrane protein OmpA-like peptidoglycan-associated protein